MSTLIHCTLDVFLQSCLGWRDELHIVLPCKEFPPGLVNVCARSMSVHLLVLSYNRITNLSMMRIASSGMSRGAEDSSNSASVSSGSTVQTAHAVFLPCRAKLDTVSHPVRAWNIGSARAFSRPNPAAISCAARYRKLWPVPNASHSWSSVCLQVATPVQGTLPASHHRCLQSG